MAETKINLDRQSVGRVVTLGTTASGGNALLTLNVGTEDASTVVLEAKGSATVEGALNLLGDLNISGDINQYDVTNLQVTDKTITVNHGGTTAGASGAGLIIEGDSASTIGALQFNGSLNSKFSIGNGSTQNEIADVASSQTLTNKTLTSPVIGDFSNATHDHTDAAGGGQLTDAALSSAIGVAKGGTGLTTLTSNAVILGNGTSSPTFVAPGASGNVLTSDGSTWQSATPSSGSSSFKSTTVSGTQDGSNKTFTIGDSLSSDSEQVFLNGQLLTPGSGNDYTLSSTTLTFTSGFSAPVSTDVIRVYGVY
jgi:hypothetical protein